MSCSHIVRMLSPFMGQTKPFGQEIKTLQYISSSTHFRSNFLLVIKSFISPETKDVKAVVNLSQSSSATITDKGDKLYVNSPHSSSKASISFYRQTARELCKQLKVHRHWCDRELSKIIKNFTSDMVWFCSSSYIYAVNVHPIKNKQCKINTSSYVYSQCTITY